MIQTNQINETDGSGYLKHNFLFKNNESEENDTFFYTVGAIPIGERKSYVVRSKSELYLTPFCSNRPSIPYNQDKNNS